jgi:hypothetical protein
MFMKTLLAVALCGVLAGPAFAQQGHVSRQDPGSSWSSRVHPYAADRYAAPQYEHNNNENPDFQLGGGER